MKSALWIDRDFFYRLVRNYNMDYSYLSENCAIDYKSQGEKLVEYYNNNVEKIAEILGVNKNSIPKGIIIVLERGDGAIYSKKDGKITYRFEHKDNILEDKGKLIHEASHVVQDYPEGIDRRHPCWCWMEGIADYCRAQIDAEFNLETDLNGHPEDGYKDTAHFLSWLSSRFKNRDIIWELNKTIYTSAHKFDDHLDVLSILVEDPPIYVLKEYYDENKGKFLTTRWT